MELDLATVNIPLWMVWVGGIAVFFVGGIIGYIDSNSRTSKKVEAAENKAQVAIKDAEMKVAAAQAQTQSKVQEQVQPANITTVTIDDPGLLRIKNVNGASMVEVDGVPLNARSITPDNKKRLIELITILRPFLESGANPQPASAPVAAAAPVQPQQSVPISVPQPITANKALDEKSFRQLSIVNQIDTVLQSRMVDTPLASRGIRLSESSSGGVEVYVGLNKFSSIDDVPDQEIKTAIRSAIAFWEEKYTPKI